MGRPDRKDGDRIGMEEKEEEEGKGKKTENRIKGM